MRIDDASITGSNQVANLLNITGSATVSGSLQITGSTNISGSLTATNTITAQTLVVQTITSSVDFVTGSTRFGTLSSNTHVFTGSMSITGGLVVSEGNTGIGTASPDTTLVVSGSKAGYYIARFRNTSATGYGIKINPGADAYEAIRISNAADNADNIKLYGDGNSEFAGQMNVGGQGRFKSWYTAGSGNAVEIGVSSTIGNVLTYDRTLGRYYPLALAGGDGAGGAQTYIYLTTNGAGIGTTTPSYSLDVQSSISSEPYVQARFLNTNGSTPYGGILVNGSNQAHIRFLTGTSTWGGAGAKQWQIRTGIASNIDALSIYSWTAGSDILYISGSGNVGISTTSPGYKLHVVGTDSAFDTSTSMRLYLNRSGTNVGSIIFTTGGPGTANGWAEIGQTDASGDLYFKANPSAGTFTTRMIIQGSTGHVIPGANGTQDLGSTSFRWGTVYTSDLSMSNGIGDYTIVEGEEDLFLYNNKTGKVFKFLIQEVDPSTAPPKKS